MTPTEKAKGINLEVMQDSIRDARNKSIGNDAVCSTAAGTAAKTVTLGTTFELVTKATIIVKFENAITVAGATLNITHTDLAGQTSSTGAKDIYYRGAALPANLVKAGMSLIMRYNGTQWDIISNIEALDDYLQVNAQNFSNAQKLQARTNIGAQENVTDMAKLGCGIGTCSTDSGTALVVSLTDYELVKNGHVSVNFEHDVPAGATLNINGKGAKPIIYKGAAIEADVIEAGDTVMFAYDGTNYVVTSLGGGGGTGPIVYPEFVTISLTQSGGSDSDLIGATVVVTNDDTSATILSTTWDGSDIAVQVDDGINYTVNVGNVNDYYIEQASFSYTAVSGILKIVNFLYLGHVVDLGLPSGNLWCTHNVGASTPDGNGLYFSWGNTVGHAKGSGYSFDRNNYNNTTGSQLSGNITDAYDAATVNMGNSWRMPTNEEFTELKNNTNKENATINGVTGVKYKKKSDSNVFIFFPNSGRYYGNSTLDLEGVYAELWSASFNTSAMGYYLEANSGGISGNYDRSVGLPIRAIMK